jgi:4-amino-4-deoxy-L-arabinose transferase-like glycosyltransferase
VAKKAKRIPRKTPVSQRTLAFLDRRARPLALALVLVATLRIVSTYPVFSHTYDEPAHIACGMEWLDRGVYTWEPQHPPLARVAAALGPYLLGIRSQATPRKNDMSMSYEGLAILYHGDRYDLVLARARLGILPFFWIACAAVYFWGERYLSRPIAVAALFLFTFLPPILAHAGLATTDMALTAFTGAAFLSGMLWLERPNAARALVFAAATAGGILSKFSFLAFFPAFAALALVSYALAGRPSPRGWLRASLARIPTLALAIAATCLLVWAGYRFSWAGGVPAPELFQGIRDVAAHNAHGHPSYLLGHRSSTGFWYFYPVALAVKTPLAFLALLGFGIALAIRTRAAKLCVPLAASAAILAVGMFSHINIGIRHVLPIYIGFSLVAGAGAIDLLRRSVSPGRLRFLLPALALWFAGASLGSHPDYLPYFNELAGSQPEKILVDSDLDWGQDIKRLAHRLHQARAEWVVFTQFAVGDLQQEQGFPLVLASDVPEPSPGWNAVSLTVWKEFRMRLYDTHPEVTPWPDHFPPQERVGKSILLWYFPTGGKRPAALAE